MPGKLAELDRLVPGGRPSERAGHLGGPAALWRRIARLQKGVRAEQRRRHPVSGHKPSRTTGAISIYLLTIELHRNLILDRN